jgi:Tfp pilus assembly protein PilF
VNLRLHIVLIIVAVITAGCSSSPQQSANNSGPTEELLAQADTLQQHGDINNAIAQVERALRLQPRNAHAWHQLATLHLASGDLNKAEQFARRSNQFAAGNRQLIDANQRVLDEVQRLRQKQSG